ncbi:hypothetical protein ACHAW6_014423 [Cyclotella cf. meneghiniana]
MFDDCILMPPPAPRFKRPRTENSVDESIVSSATTTTKAGTNDSVATASSAVYDDDYLCVSPNDDECNAQESFDVDDLDDSNIEPNAIDFESVRNIDANTETCFVHNDDGNVPEYRKEEEGEEVSIKKKRANFREESCDNLFIPSTKFRDIIGQGPAKLRLDEALLPLALPGDLADSVLTGIRAAPVSILLHGPPGCGKTKLAQAVAGEARAAFLSVGPSDILSKFVGESEASIRGLFREARRKARKLQSKCAVIFFDEIDALGRSRVDEETGAASQSSGDNSSRRILAELLIQMTELSQGNHNIDEEESDDDEYDYGCEEGDSLNGDGTSNNMTSSLDVKDNVDSKQQDVGTPTRDIKTFIDSDKPQFKSRVIVIAATNRPEDCDPALLRRFAVRVLVALPSKRDRKKIMRRLLSDVQHSLSPIQLDALARSTEGWSGSDLESMTREAVMAPVRETLRAAAILKKRASKAAQQQQRSGAGSSEGKNDNAEDMTRESLLNGFRNLRPVSCKDFEDGIAFFLGEQENENVFEHFGGGSRLSHYDSSDSSDDEVEEDA